MQINTRHLGQFLDIILQALLEHGCKIFGDNAVRSAFKELENGTHFEFDNLDESLADSFSRFGCAYFVYQWTTANPQKNEKQSVPDNVTVARHFLKSNPDLTMGGYFLDILKLNYNSPYSFFEVLSEGKEGIEVVDVLNHKKTLVMDKGFTGKTGDLIFSRIVRWQKLTVFDGTAPFYMENNVIEKLKESQTSGDLEKQGLHRFYLKWFIQKFSETNENDFEHKFKSDHAEWHA